MPRIGCAIDRDVVIVDFFKKMTVMSSVREENVGAGGDKVSRVQWRE